MQAQWVQRAPLAGIPCTKTQQPGIEAEGRRAAPDRPLGWRFCNRSGGLRRFYTGCCHKEPNCESKSATPRSGTARLSAFSLANRETPA